MAKKNVSVDKRVLQNLRQKLKVKQFDVAKFYALYFCGVDIGLNKKNKADREKIKAFKNTWISKIKRIEKCNPIYLNGDKQYREQSVRLYYYSCLVSYIEKNFKKPFPKVEIGVNHTKEHSLDSSTKELLEIINYFNQDKMGVDPFPTTLFFKIRKREEVTIKLIDFLAFCLRQRVYTNFLYLYILSIIEYYCFNQTINNCWSVISVMNIVLNQKDAFVEYFCPEEMLIEDGKCVREIDTDTVFLDVKYTHMQHLANLFKGKTKYSPELVTSLATVSIAKSTGSLLHYSWQKDIYDDQEVYLNKFTKRADNFLISLMVTSLKSLYGVSFPWLSEQKSINNFFDPYKDVMYAISNLNSPFNVPDYFSFMNKTKNELLSMDNLAYWPLFCQQIITELRGCDFFNRKWRIKEDEWPECPK